MTKINTEWAIKEIDAFISVTDQVAPRNDPSSGIVFFGTVQRGGDTEASQRAHVVEQILDRVLPGWRSEAANKEGPKRRRWHILREMAARGKAALQREEELRANLGDDAPEMDAGKLHPWAWESGATYWRTGHHNQAVMQAAIRVNDETQAKLGRMDISESDLFNQAFSLDPPKKDAPRLRLMDDDGSDTYKSIHSGAMAFARGLYGAIRNPGAHVLTEDENQHQALEKLAAFSILARWVDDASVTKA